jgi:redox-sensitive bicupin YhaK (pirin superfamily)
MISIRRADDRGRAQFGWLDSRHTFSFGHYHDNRFMGFGPLRVINDDRVTPGAGFDTHGHRDMEIVTYVLEGALEHKDSLGTGSVIRPGDVQRMSAGTGILHSEFNHSKTEPVHFLQIWILPDRAGIEPGYEQKAFAEPDRRDRLALLASRDGREGSVTVHQDIDLLGGLLSPGAVVEHRLGEGRVAWLHVAEGAATVNGEWLESGDGLAVRDETLLTIEAADTTNLLVFDMADL